MAGGAALRTALAAVAASLVGLALAVALPYPASLIAPGLAGLAAGVMVEGLLHAAVSGLAAGALAAAWAAALDGAVYGGVVVPAEYMGALALAPLIVWPTAALLSAVGARLALGGQRRGSA